MSTLSIAPPGTAQVGLGIFTSKQKVEDNAAYKGMQEAYKKVNGDLKTNFNACDEEKLLVTLFDKLVKQTGSGSPIDLIDKKDRDYRTGSKAARFANDVESEAFKTECHGTLYAPIFAHLRRMYAECKQVNPAMENGNLFMRLQRHFLEEFIEHKKKASRNFAITLGEEYPTFVTKVAVPRWKMAILETRKKALLAQIAQIQKNVSKIDDTITRLKRTFPDLFSASERPPEEGMDEYLNENDQVIKTMQSSAFGMPDLTHFE